MLYAMLYTFIYIRLYTMVYMMIYVMIYIMIYSIITQLLYHWLWHVQVMLQVKYLNACIHAAGPDSPLYSLGCHSLRIHMTSWLRYTWLHWSGICNKVALACQWQLMLWQAAPAVCGGQWSCLVEDSEAVEDSCLCHCGGCRQWFCLWREGWRWWRRGLAFRQFERGRAFCRWIGDDEVPILPFKIANMGCQIHV